MTADPSATLATTRHALQLLATHVLARRRHDVTGRFGLRPSPGGLATPAFGDDTEVVRVDGQLLIHERGGVAAVERISTLAAAGELVGVDLSADFSAGDDTMALGPVDEPLALRADDVRTLGAWWTFGAEVIDDVTGTTSAVTDPAVLQIWPEHFDLGSTVTAGSTKLNLGASPGDAFSPVPYLYLGPWGDDRPGDEAYWNAPFGAVLTLDDLANLRPADRRRRALAFLSDGIARF